jgi:hypothetical protein
MHHVLQKIVDFNPDYLTGFSSSCFGMPYIIGRIKPPAFTTIAGAMSRQKSWQSLHSVHQRLKQFGTREIVKYVIPGRIMFDQMESSR